MDNIFEIIVPLIIAGVYFFGNMLSNKSDDDAAPGAPRRASDADEDADAIERQRRIQEEIRRKIMQRRGAGESDHSRSPVPDFVEEREYARPQPAEPVREFSTPDLVTQDTDPYESEMQAKLEQIEATKRQAEKLKQQVRASSPQQRASAQSRSRSQDTSRARRRPIRSTLHDPAAARAAFIYGEVLGPPVSQRKSQSVPGLAN